MAEPRPSAPTPEGPDTLVAVLRGSSQAEGEHLGHWIRKVKDNWAFSAPCNAHWFGEWRLEQAPLSTLRCARCLKACRAALARRPAHDDATEGGAGG